MQFTARKYFGNKSRLLEFIKASLREYGVTDIKSAADLFCGTGVVSWMFADMGAYVWANDAEPYAAALTEARLTVLPAGRDLDKMYNAGQPRVGWVTRYGSAKDDADRQLFTRKTAMQLDAIAAAVPTRDVHGVAALLEATLRHSNGMGTLYTALSVAYAPKGKVQLIPVTPAVSKPIAHRVTVGDATSAKIRRRFDVIYIDPPYTRSSDYSRQYHLLNTLVLRDNPDVRGKYNVRTDAVTSRFAKRGTCKQAFEELLENCSGKCNYICISYSTYALVSLPELKALLKKTHFTKVKVYSLDVPKYGAASQSVREILIMATGARQT